MIPAVPMSSRSMPFDARGTYELPKHGGEEWEEEQRLLAAMRKAGVPLEELPTAEEIPITVIPEEQLREIEQVLAAVPTATVERLQAGVDTLRQRSAQILALLTRRRSGR